MKKLYRSKKNCQISGLCGGIGEWLDVDPTIVRILFLGSTLFLGMSIWVYILGWLIVPMDNWNL